MLPGYYIGTSGWHYNHWRGTFYPDKLPAKDWLRFYSNHFNTVEINSSFYRLPLESTFSNWNKEVPTGFCFAVKASRFITHIKRLKDTQEPVSTFLDRARNLHSHIGPILYQLPPNLHRDNARLESFLSILSHTEGKLKYVFEFRHISWIDPAVFGLLRRYNAGFCIFDMPGLTTPIEATSDFAYIRFHGKDDLYSGNYQDAELAEWAERISDLKRKLKAVYIYFNNDAAGNAVRNARTLRDYLTKIVESPDSK